MNEQHLSISLDPKILDSVADIICGDDSAGSYRSGREISEFFHAAGWRWVGAVEGGRRMWVIEQLNDRRADAAALERLLVRLVDPREYLDEEEARLATFSELNGLLGYEGLEVHYADDGPRLRERRRTFQRMDSDVPVTLTADIAGIVQDQLFGDLLKRRLDEAHLCWQSGAHLAAVILLGSLLEGVLLDFSRAHTQTKSPGSLDGLIRQAAERRWVSRDVAEYAHVLRGHRNLVHPERQHTDGHLPDSDTVRIAWNVVVAAINDLAAAGASVTLV